MKNSSSYSEFLKQENELTKLKIQAEFGFQFAEESSLNPAIENIWLKQILDYERAMVNSNKITIGEKLGNPVFKSCSELSETDFQMELQFVVEQLNKKNIVIDSVAGASDKELYKFITEELINHEVDSNSPPNMLTCFIYEEFHPNHEYDIRRRSQELIEALERKENDFSFFLSAESRDEIHEIRFEQLKRRLRLFTDAFDKVKVVNYEETSLIINEEKAKLHFKYKISLLPAESSTHHSISGEGVFTLKYLHDWWSIVDIVMKGVV